MKGFISTKKKVFSESINKTAPLLNRIFFASRHYNFFHTYVVGGQHRQEIMSVMSHFFRLFIFYWSFHPVHGFMFLCFYPLFWFFSGRSSVIFASLFNDTHIPAPSLYDPPFGVLDPPRGRIGGWSYKRG